METTNTAAVGDTNKGLGLEPGPIHHHQLTQSLTLAKTCEPTNHPQAQPQNPQDDPEPEPGDHLDSRTAADSTRETRGRFARSTELKLGPDPVATPDPNPDLDLKLKFNSNSNLDLNLELKLKLKSNLDLEIDSNLTEIHDQPQVP